MKLSTCVLSLTATAVFGQPVSAACPANMEASGQFHYLTRLQFSGSSPGNVQLGVQQGFHQWNDCNSSGYDWPLFVTGAISAEDVVTVTYTPGESPFGACGMFNRTTGDMDLWDFYVSEGNTVNCTHSAAAISDTVAHELGHYLGLGEADRNNPACATSIMGPIRVDNTGRLKTDYALSAEEKVAVDNINSNPQEHMEDECGQNREECGGQASGTGSPILLDLDGAGFRLTGLAGGVEFDLDGDFQYEQVAWTRPGSGDGFLFRNRFGDPGPDSGTELFGNFTRSLVTGERFAHGYLALAEMDSRQLTGNENGVLDPGDAFFHALGVWIDRNHDGLYGDSELFSLEELGVLEISARYRESSARDRHGNEFRFVSSAWIDDGAGRRRRILTTDVFLLLGPETGPRPSGPPPPVPPF